MSEHTVENGLYDAVSHPSHYTEGRMYEPRKVIEDWGLNFYLGNALKYISRAGRKGSAIEDLKKAKQYIDFEIERLVNQQLFMEEKPSLTIKGKGVTGVNAEAPEPPVIDVLYNKTTGSIEFGKIISLNRR